MKNIVFAIYALFLFGCAVSREQIEKYECFDPDSCIISMKDKIERNWVKPFCMYERDKVLIRVVLERDGKVSFVKLLEGSGNNVFDESAMKAVYKASPFYQLKVLSDDEFRKTFNTMSILFSPEISAKEMKVCARQYPRPPVELKSYDNDREIYVTALENIKYKHFTIAIEQMNNLLKSFPSSPLVPNSHYWLGELYMVLDQPNYVEAQKNFDAVVSEFPDNQKVPDAIYKLGKLNFLVGDKHQSKKYFNELISKYPMSPAAKLAGEYIKLF